MEARRNIYIDVEKILDDFEKAELFRWLDQPGLEILVKLIREAEYQWGYQIIKKDYVTANDSETAKDIIKIQGQREGLLIAVNSLIEWRKKIKAAQEKNDKSKK